MALRVRLPDLLDLLHDPPPKPRRGSTAAYAPSHLYDVPIPPKLKPKVKKEIEKRRKERVEEHRQRPTSAMGVGLPDLPGLRPAVGDISELATGLIPAAKTVGKAVAKDTKKLIRNRGVGGISRSTLEEYHDLLKWTVADEKGDKRKRPKSDSELIGLLAEMTRGWGRGIERALPDFSDPEDMAEFRKAWTQDPIFSALDVVPFASMITRPASIAKHTAEIGRKNDISRGKALALGLKESYRPGAARRAGLEGGIAPRTLTSDVGTVQLRPWSRTPLMRAIQERYDSLYTASGRMAETPVGRAKERAGRRRVGRMGERLQNEEQRRTRLETDELTDPVSRLVYGRMGRAAGAFGLKKNMTPKERRTATALIYRMQMPTHLAHGDALAAVQADLSEILRSGTMELPKGNKVKRAPLSEDEKRNLAIQIADLDLARRDLAEGGLKTEEMDAALESLSEIAGRTNDIGLEILERRLKLDPDAVGEIAAGWRRRSEVLPRRLANRGHLSWRAVEDSPERDAWLEILSNQLGEDQGRTLVALTDALARRIRPQDPASFWEERVGQPTGESAEAFVDRVGDNALYQMMRDHPRAGVRMGMVEGMGQETRRIDDMAEFHPDDPYFYSPLQRWLDQKWPEGAKGMKRQSLEKQIKANVPEEDYFNSGLDDFFDSYGPEEQVPKAALDEHLSSWMNSYNLDEHYFVNTDLEPDPFSDPPTPYSSKWDGYGDGALLSRDPGIGEYREIAMRLHGRARDDFQYGGKGAAHWRMQDVVAHVRFQVFDEDGIRKLLIEEIQSDWQSQSRSKPYTPMTEERKQELYLLNEEIATKQGEMRQVREERERLNAELANTRTELTVKSNFIKGNDLPADHPWHEQVIDLRERMERWGDEEQELYLRERDILGQSHDLHSERQGLEDLGIQPSPLGPKYHRAMLRRMVREAIEEDVDEIIIADPSTQFFRNSNGHELMRGSDYGSEHPPDSLQSWLREKETSGRLLTEERENLSTWRQLYGETLPNFLRKEYGGEGVTRPDAYEGRYSAEGDWYDSQGQGSFSDHGPMPGTVFKVNETMRAKAAQAQRLYQRSPDWDALPRGATELLEGRTLAHLFERGGPDTWMHELGHIALHDLHGDDFKTLADHYAGGKELGAWKEAEHENFARDWERYFRRGISPTPELASVFAKIGAWMKEVWTQAKQSGSGQALPAEVREVFDRMFDSTPDEGDELATYGYFPHRDLHEIASQEYRGGVRPAAAGQTIGVPRLTREAIERGKNELVLYQGGRLNPDPAGLVDVYLKRLRFQETLDARDELWSIGRPLTEKPPKGAWLVRNPDELPERITPEVAGAPRGQRLVREPESDLEGALSVSPDDFRKEIVARASENPSWGGDMENVRWVPGEFVNARFGQVFDSSPRGSLASMGGLLTSMQRATGIYGRPISYAAGNIPFNVTALLATMPASNLRSAERMVRMRKQNPALYRAISSEAGQTRAEAGLPGVSYTRAVNPAQAAERQVTQVQRGMADVLSSFSDDPFRVVAFLSNARKRGYNSDEELARLIEHDGTDLADVRQLTREQLLDFDALNPMQRKLASNLLYLWPFMYAATKWPLMYAREYPARAGAAAQLIEQEPERLGPMEVANFWKSKGIDLSAINPLGPGGEMAEDLDLLLKDPTSLDLTVLKERLSPTLDLLVEGMGGGKKNAIQNFVRGTVPGAAEAAAFIGEDWRGSKMYADRETPGPYLGTRHVRFWPRELNEDRMKEVIEQHKRDEVTTATLDRKKADDKAKVNRYLEAMGGVDYGEELTQSFNAWWDYQEALDEKKDSTGQRKLSPVQQVEILDEVVREHFPDYAEELYPLDRVRSAAEKDPKAVESYVTELRAIVNDGRSMLFDDYRSYAAE